MNQKIWYKRHSWTTVRPLIVIICLCLLGGCTASHVRESPTSRYSVQNAHSHNDYEQANYFTEAYNAGFGSMEADIYLVDGKLLVAHNKKDVNPARTLAAMYLEPLARHVKDNGGYPYASHNAQLELLIDLKDPKDSPAYQKGVALIRSYKALRDSRQLRFTFTGNIPSDSVMAKAKTGIFFDGVPGRSYSKAAMKKVYMLSDNFANYSTWNGGGRIADTDYKKLVSVVTAAHKSGKKIRFWNAPDNSAAWRLMEMLGVDYINTDKIQELQESLK